jgi:hypothetical protein
LTVANVRSLRKVMNISNIDSLLLSSIRPNLNCNIDSLL